MDNFDFDAQPPVSRDRIYVSWSETWTIAQYIEEYLKAHRLRTDDAARAHVHHCILRYPWTGPLRKADVDYFLGTSLNKDELQVPEMVQVVRKAGG